MKREITRREFIKAAGIAGGTLLLSACAPSVAPVPTAAPTLASQALPTTAPTVPASATVAKARLAKLTVLARNPNPPPTPRDQNLYWQEIEKRLGIQIDFNWVPTSEWSSKLSTVLASGDIPDCVSIDGYDVNVVRALTAGAFVRVQDLGLPKETRGLKGLQAIADTTWKSSMLNGVVYGIPNQAPIIQEATAIRMDWATKLGKQVPQSTDELKDLIVAFAKNDPDGNGKADTFGFGFAKGRIGWPMAMQSFGVPNKWRVKSDGTFESADITPEMKSAVASMRDLFKAGAINPDFSAMEEVAARADFASNKLGGFFNPIASVFDNPQLGGGLRKIVPDAKLQMLTPPRADGYKQVAYNWPGWGKITLINSKYAKDPELAWEVIRVIDFWLDPANDEFLNYGILGVHSTRGADGSLTTTDKGNNDIQWMRAWGPRGPVVYQDANYVLPTTRPLIKEVTDRLLKIGISNPAWGYWPELGADDPTATLDSFATSTIERIIRGDAPLESFDSFVNDWYARGGRKLTDAWSQVYQKYAR